MSLPEAYEVHHLCFHGATFEEADQYAKDFINEERIVHDMLGGPIPNPEVSGEAIMKRFFADEGEARDEYGAKLTFIDLKPAPDGGVLVFYTLVGRRVANIVFERSRSV